MSNNVTLSPQPQDERLVQRIAELEAYIQVLENQLGREHDAAHYREKLQADLEYYQTIAPNAPDYVEEALRDNERFIAQILFTIPDILYVYNLERQCHTFTNHHFSDLLGYSSGESTDLGIRMMSILTHPDDLPRLQNHIGEITKGDDNCIYEVEFRALDKNSQWRHLQTRELIFRRDADGRVVEIFGVACDITERKQAEQQKFELAVERERIQLLNRFVRDASHEFRTPLTIINSNAYLMETSDDAVFRGERARIIEDQIQGLSQLIDSLVLMVRLDSQIALEMEPADFNLFVRQFMIGYSFIARQKNLSVDVQLTSEQPYILCNFQDFGRALKELIDNALRYTQPDGKLSVRTEVKNRGVMLTIQDSGKGISPAALPRVFERFFREDNSHSTRGFGLGLPIARRIIEMHGGKIAIESQPGKGTTCRVLLPLFRPASAS